MDLNTSNVDIKPRYGITQNSKNANLNTSNVDIKHYKQSLDVWHLAEFKYI